MKHEDLLNELVLLKEKAGNHSPSLVEINKIIGRDPVEIDACFLSNPYATDLIYNSGILEEINKNFFKMVESYPPNQGYILHLLNSIEGVNVDNAIVMSGAQACIEILMTNLEYKNCLLPIPTYSSYYESVREDAKMHYFHLVEKNNFQIDETKISAYIEDNGIDLLILINPNNPTGIRVDNQLIHNLLSKHQKLKIIIDESFCHFLEDLEGWRNFKKNNLHNERCFFIKSMSKDYGIAGFRIGYFETTNSIIEQLKAKYGTWALNNMAVKLLELMSNNDFLVNYEKARKQYLQDKKIFFKELRQVKGISVFESDSNFFLIKLINKDVSGFRFVMDLLLKTGLYVRSMDDKIGLDSSYIRVACRSKDENSRIIKIFKENI